VIMLIRWWCARDEETAASFVVAIKWPVLES